MATITQRRLKDGSVRHVATIRMVVSGQTHVESRTFDRKAMAVAWAVDRERLLREDPGSLRSREHARITIGDLLARYLEERQATEPLGRSKLQHILFLTRQPIAERPVMKVDAADYVEHVRQRRLAGAGGSTVLNDLIWLRVVYRYARTVWRIPIPVDAVEDAVALCRHERLVRRPQRRNRRPTDDELRRIGDFFLEKERRRGRGPTKKMPMYLIMWFAITSCRRQSEIFSMRWEDLDAERRAWKIGNVKNPCGSEGNDKWMHVTDAFWTVIEACVPKSGSPSGLVFDYESKSVGSAWTRAMHMLDIQDLHFHDLRHEGCSRLAESGMTIPEIQQVSLHDSWSSLQIYVNAFQSPSAKRPGGIRRQCVQFDPEFATRGRRDACEHPI